MGIIYFISILALIIAFILIKKTEKELDIVSFISISVVTLLCYNPLVCYILTFIGIKITLLNLAIINAIFATIMYGVIIKKKSIQKYKFDKMRFD